MTHLQEQYRKTVVSAMRNEFHYGNVWETPKVDKVVLNVGIGRITKDQKAVDHVVADLTKLSGQKPVLRKARKSIASFKVREGVPVGVVVTLRGKRMYDFLERLIHIALPRSRDFRGIDQKRFDGAGNLNIGIGEHNIFPEIEFESVKDIFGLEVTVATTAKTKAEGVALLRLLGFPIRT